MPDYGKISWQSAKKLDKTSSQATVENQIDAFFELCKKLIPNKNLLKSCKAVVEESAELSVAHKKIINKLSPEPFLAAFMVWTKEVAFLHLEMMNASKLLLEHGFIGVIDKKGVVWTIGDAHEFDHRQVIDAIRCKHELPLLEQEQLVTTYISFMQWLAEKTQGYITKLEDPDLLKVMGKALPFPRFVSFLNALKEKEQIVAKLLYYGGNPTLDEVLNIHLEDINFEKKLIRYPSQLINYPTHVFADIRALTGKKTHGRLFLGRQDAPLHSTTIFRNFKEAALKAGLEPSFSPASLTTSH